MYSLLLCVSVIAGSCVDGYQSINYPSQEECLDQQRIVMKQIKQNNGVAVCYPKSK